MIQDALMAGAASQIITPEIGKPLVGWHNRATGDSLSRGVRDDLYVKTLVLQRGATAWAVVAADVVGVDPVATERIRAGIAGQTGLAPDMILVCATHCHSGPAVCPIASAISPDRFVAVQSDGSLPKLFGSSPSEVTGAVYYADYVDAAWRETFIARAIEATVQAWRTREPAAIAFGQAETDGLASSRRVLMSDGSWADPRQPSTGPVHEVQRTNIDTLVRVLLVRRLHSAAPLAAIVNYGSHPWVFSAPLISSEVPGVMAATVAAEWRAPGMPAPIVLFLTGPEGDVSLIWNMDIEEVWMSRTGETPGENLARRQAAFDRELRRLGDRLAGRVLAAIAAVEDWEEAPALDGRRCELLLPLKPGYRRPAEVLLSGWQEAAPPKHHLTELQALRVGDVAILGLPGEPFANIGLEIRRQSRFPALLVAAIANDYGELSYIGDRRSYELGGYELTHTPTAAGAGEMLVERSVSLLEDTAWQGGCSDE